MTFTEHAEIVPCDDSFFGLCSFLWQCYRHWRMARRNDAAQFFRVSQHGVCNTTVLIARGRNAQIVSEFAIAWFDTYFRTREKFTPPQPQ